VTRIFKCGGAAGIPIYPGGGRLCLSACLGGGEVKKIAAHLPENNFWNSPKFGVFPRGAGAKIQNSASISLSPDPENT